MKGAELQLPRRDLHVRACQPPCARERSMLVLPGRRSNDSANSADQPLAGGRRPSSSSILADARLFGEPSNCGLMSRSLSPCASSGTECGWPPQPAASPGARPPWARRTWRMFPSRAPAPRRGARGNRSRGEAHGLGHSAERFLEDLVPMSSFGNAHNEGRRTAWPLLTFAQYPQGGTGTLRTRQTLAR